MQGKPDVIDALNNVLVWERTASEGFHDQEHALERKEYKELRKWWDGQVEDSRTRRRRLLKALFIFDQIPGQDSNTFPASFDPTDAFRAFLDFMNNMFMQYEAAIQVAYEAKDCDIAKMLCKGQKACRKAIAETEAYLQQIDALSIGDFISSFKA